MPERDAPSRQEQLLQAILALLAADRDDRLDDRAVPRRAEVVLADAGLSVADIAALLGKNRETVKSTVRRARKA